METYYVDKIEKRELNGRICEIKYIQTYAEKDCKNWLKVLFENHYDIIWRQKHEIMFKQKVNDEDIVILTCKMGIKISWLYQFDSHFKDFKLID